MDNIQFKAPEESKTVLKLFGVPVFSKTKTKTIKYDTTELYKKISEEISNDLTESLKKLGVIR